MRAKSLGFMVVLLLMSIGASAQEGTGAERVEINSAMFGGGMLFVPSASMAEPRSRSYALSGAVTANVNRWIGLEGDVGVALTRERVHSLYGVVPSGARTPTVLLYSANVLYSPFASDRAAVPYVSGGLGALTVFADVEAPAFGLATGRTYPTAFLGAGVRWFPMRHWGVRGDYRYAAIRNSSDPAPAGRRIATSAHRIYGALVLTFGT